MCRATVLVGFEDAAIQVGQQHDFLIKKALAQADVEQLAIEKRVNDRPG
jgi:hypothetical protein